MFRPKLTALALACTLLCATALAQENNTNDIENAEGNVEQNNKETKDERKYYDLSGFTLELSSPIGIGLGYNWGEQLSAYSHFWADEYGLYIEYKRKKELHSRIYYERSGGSALLLLGASVAMLTDTDFEKTTVGIAPHIGIAPGIKLFYRYNLCVNKEFNSHEVVLTIPMYKPQRIYK